MCLRLASAYMSGYESYPLIFMWSEEVTMGLLELFLLAIGLSMDAFGAVKIYAQNCLQAPAE